jgi:flagellin FlaB
MSIIKFDKVMKTFINSIIHYYHGGDMVRRGEKAQVGIGTLIVFIAMVLVAAIAAAVLINTAGMLQQRAQTTGKEATEQTSTGLTIMGVNGTVDDTSDTVHEIGVAIKLRPGSQNIDLADLVVVYSDDDNTVELTRSTVADNDNFLTWSEQDDDSSHPVLNSREDIFVLMFDLADIRAGSAGAATSNGLGEGKEASIKLIPATGATTTYSFTVPESVDGKSQVDLT